MVSKAAFLSIEVIASRTSPSDLAAKMFGEPGITLIGYVRGRRLTSIAVPINSPGHMLID